MCNQIYKDVIESTSSLPISMILSPGTHGFKIPDDFEPVLLANVAIISPDDQYKEGKL